MKLPVDGTEVEALAAAVTRLLDHPERREQMSEAAQRFVRAHHRLDGAARGLVEVVGEVAASPASLPADRWCPTSDGFAVRRLVVALAYRLFRVKYLLRAYGLRDTVRRVAEELHSRS